MEVLRFRTSKTMSEALGTLARDVVQGDEEGALAVTMNTSTWVHGRIEGARKSGFRMHLQRRAGVGWEDIYGAVSYTNTSGQWGMELTERGWVRVVSAPPKGSTGYILKRIVHPPGGAWVSDMTEHAVEFSSEGQETIGDIVFWWGVSLPTATPEPTVRPQPTDTVGIPSPTPTGAPTIVVTPTPITGFQQFDEAFRFRVVLHAAGLTHLGATADEPLSLTDPTVKYGMIDMGLGAPLTPRFTLDGKDCRGYSQGILVMDPEQTDTAVPYGVIVWSSAQLGGTEE